MKLLVLLCLALPVLAGCGSDAAQPRGEVDGRWDSGTPATGIDRAPVSPGRSTGDAQAAAAAPTAPAQRSGVGTAGQDGQRRVLLDLRDQPPHALPNEEEARELVEQVFGDGAPANATVVGYASGSFTAPDLQQQIVVIARPMVTARPAPPQGMISVLQDGRAVADFVPDIGYHALAGTADINDDGSDELLLQVDSMQMGIISSAIHVVSLSDGELQVLQRFENMVQDSCDNPVGERNRRASVLFHSPDGIERNEYQADCDNGAYHPAHHAGDRPVTRDRPAR